MDTSGHEAGGRDIADTVLTCARARLVVENFESSDGHEHDYYRYLAHGGAGGKQGVAVLLEPLRAHIAGDARRRHAHPQQEFFINQRWEHFMEGAESMSREEQIASITSMCETGESARCGHRPPDVAAQKLAELPAQHAKRQFEVCRADTGRAREQRHRNRRAN